MDMISIALFIVGIVALIYGARQLVNGASHLATALGIPPLVVGLTVVAFGTSAPELATALQATWSGQAGIALGNVVGSNIFNVLIVLGLAAVIAPVAVHSKVVRIDVPIMIGISVLLYLFALDGEISRLDGAVFVVGLGVYLYFTFRPGTDREGILPEAEEVTGADHHVDRSAKTIVMSVVHGIVGLVLLTLGSDWLVTSSVTFARAFGVSELVIGLTIVSIGTSLPEIATSVLASLHGKGDLAVGNVVGSNIFNMLSVLGITAAVSPVGVAVAPDALRFDIPVMVGVVLMALPVFYTGFEVRRWEGVLFLGYYVAYTTGIFLIARRADELETYTWVMLWIVIPLTALMLATLSIHAYVTRRRHRV